MHDIAQGKPVRRYNQIIGFATAISKRASTSTCTTSAMGNFQRDYAFSSLKKETQYVAPAATFEGIVRADGRVATAQLHRHPDQRELLGYRRADDCRAFQEQSKNTRMWTAWWRLRTRPAAAWHPRGKAWTSCAARWRAMRAIRILRDAGDRPGLRGEPDQQPAVRAKPQAARPHARLHDPGEGRHDEGGAGGHCASRRSCPRRTR